MFGNVIGDSLAAANNSGGDNWSGTAISPMVDPTTGGYSVFNNTQPSNNFASIDAMAAAAPNFGNQGPDLSGVLADMPSANPYAGLSMRDGVQLTVGPGYDGMGVDVPPATATHAAVNQPLNEEIDNFWFEPSSDSDASATSYPVIDHRNDFGTNNLLPLDSVQASIGGASGSGASNSVANGSTGNPYLDSWHALNGTQAERDADPNYQLVKASNAKISVITAGQSNESSSANKVESMSESDNKLGPSDYIGAGLSATSSASDQLLERAGVESVAKYGIKYGVPALISDLPGGVGAALSLAETVSAFKQGKNEEAVNNGTAALGAIGGTEAGLAIGGAIGGGTPLEVITLPLGAVIGGLGGAYGGKSFAQAIQKIGFDGFLSPPTIEKINSIPLPSADELRHQD